MFQSSCFRSTIDWIFTRPTPLWNKKEAQHQSQYFSRHLVVFGFKFFFFQDTSKWLLVDVDRNHFPIFNVESLFLISLNQLFVTSSLFQKEDGVKSLEQSGSSRSHKTLMASPTNDVDFVQTNRNALDERDSNRFFFVIPVHSNNEKKHSRILFFCCFFFQTVFQTEQQAKGPTRRRFDFVSLLLSLQRRVFSFSQSPAASAGGEWVERVGFILFFFVFFCFSGVPGGLMSRPSLNQQHSRLTWGSVGNPHQIELLEMAHHTHPPTHPPILCVCVCVCVLLCVALYRVGFG